MNAHAQMAGVQPGRLVSLDALRGFDMFWIVGGSGVATALAGMQPNAFTSLLTTQLTHATWVGFRFYDLIFPLFLFIMGVSLVFSLDKALAVETRSTVLSRAARRAMLLFALGVFTTGGLSKPWPDVQLGGVLHRIGACSFLAATIYVFVRNARGLMLVSAALLLGYWWLLTFVPIPDLRLEQPVVEEIAARIGSTSPAAISASIDARVTGSYEEGRNLTNYLDFRFMPGRKPQRYYMNEGLLSTLPAIALPLFGALAGMLLKKPGIPSWQKAGWLLAGGAVCVAAGLVWSIQFPLIKRIWTSSFVLVSGGVSACLLAAFYWIVDVCGWRTWCQPFVWIGCNPLTIYVVAPIIGFRALATRLVGGDITNFLDTHVCLGCGGFVVAMMGLMLVVMFARFLFQRGIFLRV